MYRNSIIRILGKTIALAITEQKNANNNSDNYIEKFASYLVNESEKRMMDYQGIDPVAVISTNWDILLDNAINKALGLKRSDNNPAVVDYCCHISSLEENDKSVKPGLEILGKGGFIVKLIKLHGSLNWLLCPTCSRLYATFGDKLAIGDEVNCRHCDKNFKEAEEHHKLTPNLIMPTYLKDLTNPQYKIIWQNAGIEISESDKLVFIGYSLPVADFELRQLLSRMTRRNAKIEVVDFASSEEEKIQKKKPWHHFFNRDNVSFYFDGAKDYIENQIRNY